MAAFTNLPDGPNNWLLRLIAAAFWNNDGTRRTFLSTAQSVSAVGFGSTTTNASNAVFVPLGNKAANKVEIFNMTGKTLDLRMAADPANVFHLPDQTSKVFTVIANVSEVEVAPDTNGAVSFDWEWVKN